MNTEATATLWRLYKQLTDKEKRMLLKNHDYMPEKGYGGIWVGEGQQKQAHKILQDCVGVAEMEYYPEGFISQEELPCIYYGKFEIDDPMNFLEKLIENGITIRNVQMFKCLKNILISFYH